MNKLEALLNLLEKLSEEFSVTLAFTSAVSSFPLSPSLFPDHFSWSSLQLFCLPTYCWLPVIYLGLVIKWH